MAPPNPDYPVRLEIDYPGPLSRLLIFVKWLLAIPALIAAGIIGLIAYVVAIVAWFAILFTGRYPQDLFDVVTIALRWNSRVTLFTLWATELYPPFVWA